MNTRNRWKSRSKGEYLLFSQMDDRYILCAIRYILNKRGHKHTKLDGLVAEARKRGLPLPAHKWIKSPEGETVPDAAEYRDAMAPTIKETPDYFYK